MTEESQPNDESAIVLECRLDHPPEKVWRALTEPKLLARWLMLTENSLEQGRRLQAELAAADAPEGRVEAEVLAFVPQRLMRLSWRGSDDRRDGNGDRLDSVVSFELQQVVGGTRLRIVHSGLAARPATANVVPLCRRMTAPRTEMRLAA